MKVLICGSRDWTDWMPIRALLIELASENDGNVLVIHGDQRGADRIAAKEADDMGLRVEPFPADWDAHGRAAGPIRNRQMLDEKPDLVVAFQRNGSRGTQDTIDEARRRGITVEVHKDDAPVGATS